MLLLAGDERVVGAIMARVLQSGRMIEDIRIRREGKEGMKSKNEIDSFNLSLEAFWSVRLMSMSMSMLMPMWFLRRGLYPQPFKFKKARPRPSLS